MQDDRSDVTAQICKNNRRVKFPSDESIVTHFIEPLNPWKDVRTYTNEEILLSYEHCCQKIDIKPIPFIVAQLKALPSHHEGRLSCLLLKDVRLNIKQVEALEEVLKRVRFVTLDLENALKNDEACSSLLDSIEYYESATHLVLRQNTDAGLWTWKAVCHLIRRSSFLESFDCSNTNLMQFALIPFTRSLRQNHSLASLDLSDCHLSGRPFHFLVNALKTNLHLRNLYLRSNHLTARDMIKLGELLMVNSHLQFLNLSFNPIQDVGLRELVCSLLQQLKNMASIKKDEHAFELCTTCNSPNFVTHENSQSQNIQDSPSTLCYCQNSSYYRTSTNNAVLSHPDPIKSPPPSPAINQEFYQAVEHLDNELPSDVNVEICESPNVLNRDSHTIENQNGPVESDSKIRFSFPEIDETPIATSPNTSPPFSTIFLRGSGLRHLSLAQCNLTANGISELAPFLIHPSCALKNLCLGMNNIEDLGILDLKPCLLNNRSLHKLDLRQCRLGDEAAIALAEVLGNEPQSCSLKTLDLRQNPQIKFAGVLALARALEFNTNMQYLILDDELTATPSSKLNKPDIGSNNDVIENSNGDDGMNTKSVTAAKKRFFLPLKGHRWKSDNWLVTLFSPTSNTPAQSPNDIDTDKTGKNFIGHLGVNKEAWEPSPIDVTSPSDKINGEATKICEKPGDSLQITCDTPKQMNLNNSKHSLTLDHTTTDIPTYLAKYKEHIESLCQKNRQT